MKSRNFKIFAGISGEHYVAAEISRRWKIATITSKNTPNVDILASNEEGSKVVSIQVKTNIPNQGIAWTTHLDIDVSDSLFYVFVNLKEGNTIPDFYIVPSKIVAERVKFLHDRDLAIPRKDGSKRDSIFAMNIGFEFLNKEEEERYHNNWNVLGLD